MSVLPLDRLLPDCVHGPWGLGRPAARVPESLPVPGICREVRVKVASERAEWEQAFALVAARYEARGYTPRGGEDLHITPYHALPDTTTFVAVEAGRVIATLSLVLDNARLGLPLESIYPEEIGQFRAAGRRLAEVVNLAADGVGAGDFIPVMMALMRLMTWYFLDRGADGMAISVNPRHAAFYRKVLGFVPIGTRRPYPAVQDHPAEAYFLDHRLPTATESPAYRRLLGERPPAAALVTCHLPARLVRAFARRASPENAAEIAAVLRDRPCAATRRRWLAA